MLLNFGQVESNDLLDCKSVSLVQLFNLEGHLAVVEFDDFVSNESLLKLKLLLAGSVETEETSSEKTSVFKVLVDLELDCLTGKSLCLSKGDFRRRLPI